MNTLEKLAAELLAADQARPRSQQTQSGASSVGDCRARLLLRATGAEASDRRLSLATLGGTALHAACETAAGTGVLTERSFAYRGIWCTIDRYDPDARTLTDYKTLATPAKVDERRVDGPRENQRSQVHLGAAALLDAGYPVDTVELLFLPRSIGGVDDCWLWSEPFNKDIADEAADWLLRERERAASFDRPASSDDLHDLRDGDFFRICPNCEFLSLCRGTDPGPRDDEYADAARRYVTASRAERTAKELKAEARADLEGFTGTAGDFTVKWRTPDQAEVKDVDALMALWRFVNGDQPIPTKQRASYSYPVVKQVKS